MQTIVANNQTTIEEKLITNFAGRLTTGEYKVILCDGQTPVISDDLGLIELINDEFRVKTIDNDTIIIYSNREIIELKGYKEMSDEEIFARRYLDNCESGLIVKDSLEQVELREDNFVNSEDYYIKCKDIVNIRTVAEDDEHYKMNWDCIIVEFDNGIEKIWQRN